MLDVPERGLAVARENVGNLRSGGFRDPIVQVDMSPADLPRQQLGDRGLAGPHKTYQANKPWRTGLRDWGHRFERNFNPAVVGILALMNVDCAVK